MLDQTLPYCSIAMLFFFAIHITGVVSMPVGQPLRHTQRPGGPQHSKTTGNSKTLASSYRWQHDLSIINIRSQDCKNTHTSLKAAMVVLQCLTV